MHFRDKHKRLLFFSPPRSDKMNWSWKNLTLLCSHSPETLQKQSFPHAGKNRNKPKALKTSCRELQISLSQSQTLRSSLLGYTIQLLAITSTPYSGLGFCFFLHHANTRRVWQDRCMDFWKATWNSRVQLPPQHLGRGLNSKAVAVWAGVKTGSPASRNHGLLHLYNKPVLFIKSLLKRPLVTAVPKPRTERNSELGGFETPQPSHSLQILCQQSFHHSWQHQNVRIWKTFLSWYHLHYRIWLDSCFHRKPHNEIQQEFSLSNELVDT